ncbi:hypothetical protein L218DRAFT_903449 [Marasmius fiardii PR-910]|nr:hypothetical protein L218DRAFT_903449 [Marasmius fiardii PR-910]
MPFLDDSVLSSVGRVAIEPIITLSIQFFAYGFYVLLFGICIRVLLKRENRSNKRLFLSWSIALFILATVSAGCETFRFIWKTVVEYAAVKTGDETGLIEFYTRNVQKNIMDGFFFSLFILTNLVADSILMYRCYILWGSRKLVILVPILATIAFTVIGFVGLVMFAIGSKDQTIPSNLALVVRGDMLEMVYMVGSASVNTLLTLLTAGRIWWISREARALMGRPTGERYRTIVAIILESGMLYPIFSILHIALTETSDIVYVPVNFLPTVAQMGAIAPTLIIVRASLGATVDSVHTVLSTVHFQEGHSVAMFSRPSGKIPSSLETDATPTSEDSTSTPGPARLNVHLEWSRWSNF